MSETIVIAKGSHGALKPSQRLLARAGIQAEIVAPPGCDLNA